MRWQDCSWAASQPAAFTNFWLSIKLLIYTHAHTTYTDGGYATYKKTHIRRTCRRAGRDSLAAATAALCPRPLQRDSCYSRPCTQTDGKLLVKLPAAGEAMISGNSFLSPLKMFICVLPNIPAIMSYKRPSLQRIYWLRDKSSRYVPAAHTHTHTYMLASLINPPKRT